MKVPVLSYHDVLPRDVLFDLCSRDRHYSLDMQRFRRQMKYLYNNRFETISISNPVDPNGKPVVLTFDDGYKSNYQCFSLLKAFKFIATFFVTTNFVGKDRYLDWDQLHQMHEEGMNIQSHTCSHPILTEISLDQLRFEFAHSKKIIEKNLDKEVDSISIPQGFVSPEIIRIAKDCGYEYIFTSEPGPYDTEAGQIVKRLSIYKRTTMSQFKKLVNMDFFEIKKQQLYKNMLGIPKRILGDRNYHSLRLKILEKIEP